VAKPRFCHAKLVNYLENAKVEVQVNSKSNEQLYFYSLLFCIFATLNKFICLWNFLNH
jgi:hypothetical protein